MIEMLIACFLFALFTGLVGEAYVICYRSYLQTETKVDNLREVTVGLETLRQDLESSPHTTTPAVGSSPINLLAGFQVQRNAPNISSVTTSYAFVPDTFYPGALPPVYMMTRTVGSGTAATIAHGIVAANISQSVADPNNLVTVNVQAQGVVSMITSNMGWAVQ